MFKNRHFKTKQSVVFLMMQLTIMDCIQVPTYAFLKREYVMLLNITWIFHIWIRILNVYLTTTIFYKQNSNMPYTQNTANFIPVLKENR